MNILLDTLDFKLEKDKRRGEPDTAGGDIIHVSNGVFYDPHFHKQGRVGWYCFVSVGGMNYAAAVDFKLSALPCDSMMAERIAELVSPMVAKVAAGKYRRAYITRESLNKRIQEIESRC